MKKLMLLLVVLVFSSMLFAQDVQQQFMYTDDFNLMAPLLLPDGLTAVPDGYLIEVCLPVVAGVKDYDNDFHGVQLNNLFPVNFMNGAGFGLGAGFFLTEYFVWEDAVGSPAEPVANCGEQIYLRIYDAVDQASANNYLNSDFILGPSAGAGTSELEVSVWDAWVALSTPGYGEDTSLTGELVVVDVADIDLPTTRVMVNPDVTFDPVTGPLAVAVQVAGDPQLAIALPTLAFPENVLISYVTTFTGQTDQQIDFVLSYSGYGVDLNKLCWWDGFVWICELEGFVYVFDDMAETVTFSVTPTVEMDGVFEFVLGTDEPCPVTLASFSTAVFANEFVQISWVTESETNNQGWNIYRSLSDNLQIAEQINATLIPGAGSTTEPTEYRFQDEYVENNTTYYYWLESVSYDQCFYHGPSTLTVVFEETPELPDATLLKGNYPNPFNPVTIINFDIKDGETAKLTIFDIKGRVVETATYGPEDHTHTWEANSSASGVYFYKLESPSTTSVKKMMLLK